MGIYAAWNITDVREVPVDHEDAGFYEAASHQDVADEAAWDYHLDIHDVADVGTFSYEIAVAEQLADGWGPWVCVRVQYAIQRHTTFTQYEEDLPRVDMNGDPA